MSESTEDRRDEVDEKDDDKAQKPGEQDTETVAGYPKESPAHKNKSKQDE
jgi:hypothetical protein